MSWKSSRFLIYFFLFSKLKVGGQLAWCPNIFLYYMHCMQQVDPSRVCTDHAVKSIDRNNTLQANIYKICICLFKKYTPNYTPWPQSEFDRLNWQYSGEFDQNFSKKSNAPGFARGEGRFWNWPVHNAHKTSIKQTGSVNENWCVTKFS